MFSFTTLHPWTIPTWNPFVPSRFKILLNSVFFCPSPIIPFLIFVATKKTAIWANDNDLTATSLKFLVDKGTYPTIYSTIQNIQYNAICIYTYIYIYRYIQYIHRLLFKVEVFDSSRAALPRFHLGVREVGGLGDGEVALHAALQRPTAASFYFNAVPPHRGGSPIETWKTYEWNTVFDVVKTINPGLILLINPKRLFNWGLLIRGWH